MRPDAAAGAGATARGEAKEPSMMEADGPTLICDDRDPEASERPDTETVEEVLSADEMDGVWLTAAGSK